MVTVAGRRWSIEESFQAAKTGLGLDQHQHRRWKAWRRWTTLVIAAHAELRRLFHALVLEPARRIADAVAWSIYRRKHQDTAKTSHYSRQALTEP